MSRAVSRLGQAVLSLRGAGGPGFPLWAGRGVEGSGICVGGREMRVSAAWVLLLCGRGCCFRVPRGCPKGGVCVTLLLPWEGTCYSVVWCGVLFIVQYNTEQISVGTLAFGRQWSGGSLATSVRCGCVDRLYRG